MAFTSHLPQLVATALAAALDGRPEPRTGVYGPALVDSTRLALSSFDIWGDIFDTNRVKYRWRWKLVAKLEEFRQDLEAGMRCDATLTLLRTSRLKCATETESSKRLSFWLIISIVRFLSILYDIFT